MTLSIIVTTFNIEDYIAQCLESIVNQTIRDIEIIVVDDASTDRTVEVINQFAQKDNRIKTIVFEKNTIGGVSSAANAGLEIATGEYVGFADGDDWYELDMFERLLNKAKDYDADVSFCNYLEFDESLNEKKVPSDGKKWIGIQGFIHQANQSDDFKKLFLRFNPVPWRKIYKRTWLESHQRRFPVGDYFFEDNPFHWQTTILANSIVFDDFIGCYHRLNRPGQSMARADRKLLAMYEHHQTIRGFLQQAHYSQYDEQSVGWLVGNTCWIARKMETLFIPELFTCFKNQLSFYPKDWVASLINTPVFGRYGSDLVKSVLNNDYDAFVIISKGKPLKSDNNHSPLSPPPNTSTSSLIKQSIHTLKTEGVKSFLHKVKAYLEYRFNLKIHNVFWVSNRTLLREIQVLKTQGKTLQQEVKVLKLALLLQQREQAEQLRKNQEEYAKVNLKDEV